MGTYNPTSLGIKPPSGGFQEGGWYSGRQYIGGTLSDPGVIHPGSSQQGAGQAVSNEVVAQTNPNNVAYIASEQKKAGVTPGGNAPAPSYSSLPGSSGSSTAGSLAGAPQASINLPELYKSLINESGIQQTQDQLSSMEKDFIEAQGKINDNPFLSEATRVGRVAKLDQLYQQRTANLRGDVATKKADVEMQLNLQSKQFDINNEQAKLALSQFNSLLESGALNNANGEDIAAITRTTGLSSNMISSAIEANKAKSVKTEMVKFDDGINQGFAVVNTQTGEIISTQIVAGSDKKTTSNSGGSGSGGGLTTTQQRNVTSEARKAVGKFDTNKDKRLSLQEYTNAVSELMTSTGIDFSTADDYAAKAFTDLGYSKWGKGWPN